MEISNFIEKLKDVFEDTDPALLTPDSVYKNLDEWSSLTALSIIGMIDDEYGITIKGSDIREAKTIGDLFNAIKDKA